MDIKTLIAVATGKIPHNYRSGLCPDELQPDSRDPDCPACKILIEAATEHDAMERELRAAEIRLHDVATLCANVESELEAERAKRERQEPVAYLTADKNMLVFADKCVDMQHLMTPLYAFQPVTAPVRLTDKDFARLYDEAGFDPNEMREAAEHMFNAIQSAVLRANGFDIQAQEGK